MYASRQKEGEVDERGGRWGEPGGKGGEGQGF